ncbi:MAG: hypothetical protein SFU85_05420 [Candidatus Methylacidiphilales bacterium]|nr:hypothetical protein [Candidatus Methylacidiphilales bacterium]
MIPLPQLLARMLPDPEAAHRPEPWTRSDWRLVLFLGPGFTLLYLLTASCAPDDWDSIQFLRGLDHFNIKLHQPHPPGYPLYLGAAWLVRALTGVGGHTAFTTISALGGAVAVLASFVLARTGLSRFWALCGSLAVGFSPMLWMNAIKAMTDAPASGFLLATAAVGTAAWFHPSRRYRLLLLASACAVVASGLRPQNSFAALLILGVSLGVCRIGWRPSAIVLVCWMGGCLLWLLPTMALQAAAENGDFWTSYWAGNNRQFRWRFDQPLIYAGADLAGDPLLIKRLGIHLASGLFLGLGNGTDPSVLLTTPLVLVGLAGFMRRVGERSAQGLVRQVVVQLSWMAPYAFMMFVFLPGSSRYYIPVLAPLVLAATAGWSAWGRCSRIGVLGAIALPVTFLCVSLPLAWQNHTEPCPPFRAVTWLEEQVPPGERASTLVVLNESLRHFQQAAPGFRVVELDKLRKPGAWESALAGMTRVYTESNRLPVVVQRNDLGLREAALFQRPPAIHFKHWRVRLYRVEGWQAPVP